MRLEATSASYCESMDAWRLSSLARSATPIGPFDEQRSCPKCGAAGATAVFVDAGFEKGEWRDTEVPRFLFGHRHEKVYVRTGWEQRERIVRTCRCSYRWVELPLDSEVPA